MKRAVFNRNAMWAQKVVKKNKSRSLVIMTDKRRKNGTEGLTRWKRCLAKHTAEKGRTSHVTPSEPLGSSELLLLGSTGIKQNFWLVCIECDRQRVRPITYREFFPPSVSSFKMFSMGSLPDAYILETQVS